MKYRPSLLASLCLASHCLAQGPSQNLISPEVHADRTVTFRIYAPKASEVTLHGDWMPSGPRPKLTRGDNGVWSFQAGPLPPQVYLYSFNVDGMSIADPVNPRMKLRARTSASLVEVPGDEPWQFRDVPHGAVEINLHKSTVTGEPRQVFVYTPPDYYKKPNARYPVLYLLHGNNDVAAGWTFTGNAHLILDNLIAEQKARPMLIVMPWGHAVPFGSPAERQATNNQVFEEYLLKEVMPMIDAKYRTLATSRGRALAGLSMGGRQTLEIGLKHLDRFAALGLFSSGLPRDFEARFSTVLADAKTTNAKLDLFWIGIGKDDEALGSVRNLHAALEKSGIRHAFIETEGAHFYPVWRRMLTEFAPELFRGRSATSQTLR